MSGIKDQAMTEFYRKLRARGHTITSLSDLMMCGRAHLTLVINGRRSGKQTWRKLALVLTAEEMELLQRARGGRDIVAERGALIDEKVSRETLLPVEH